MESMHKAALLPEERGSRSICINNLRQWQPSSLDVGFLRFNENH